jgi:hypothetical protein
MFIGLMQEVGHRMKVWDVVTFNRTYFTNKYGMPFASFMGVNHLG